MSRASSVDATRFVPGENPFSNFLTSERHYMLMKEHGAKHKVSAVVVDWFWQHGPVCAAGRDPSGDGSALFLAQVE